MYYFKTVDGGGKPSYGTATGESAIPDGATRFSDNAAYSADMMAYVLAQMSSGQGH